MKPGTKVKIVAVKPNQDFKNDANGRCQLSEKQYIGMFVGKFGHIESVDSFRYPVTVRFQPAVTFQGDEQLQRFGFGEVEFNG